MEHEWTRMLWAEAWQVTLLILAVAVLSRWVGRNHPHFAHALWVVVLLKAVTPPIWSSPSGVFSWLQSPVINEEEPAETIAVPQPAPPPEPVSRLAPVLPVEADAEGGEWPEPQIASAQRNHAFEPIVIESEPVMEIPEPLAKPAAVPVAAPAESPAWPLWQVVVLAVWLCGMLGSLLLAWARWMACRREIRRAEVVDDPAAQQLLNDLCIRLRVRRNVRLIISRSRIGPAVLGVFRPTVLIPARILEGQPPADLEPILAHELIHVRRGDLWVGWLEVLAQSVWWFHPLVWWAGRLVKREAERCCDEEVIAELAMKPARYARALLDVLELKHILKPVPVLPGVKPVEITSNRLERIMLLRQGCRKRTPWWCWLVMLLTAALTLPGAAFVAQGKEKPNRKLREKQKAEASQTNALRTRRFKVGDVLERYQGEYKIRDEAFARSTLAELLKDMVGELWCDETLRTNGEAVAPPSITIKGNTLRVRHTPRVLEKISEELEILREHGFAQIAIEARIITASRDVVEKAVSHWEVLPAEGPERTRPETKVENGVRSTIEKSAPLRMAILDDPQVKKLIEVCQSDVRTNLMFCPKVTLFNGQHAMIQDTVQRPFVVGISSDGKPTIRGVEEGTKMQLRAVWKGDHIRLESHLTLSDIRKVDVVDLPGKAGDELSPKVQVPEVASTRINNTVKLPSGGSVLLGGLKLPDEGRVPAGRSLFNRLGLTTEPQKPEQQLFVVLRVVHLENPPEKLPAPPKNAANSSDVEVRYAKKAAELADLEYEKALKANRHLKGTVSSLEVERLKLTADMAHLHVEQAEHELELKKAGTRLKSQPMNNSMLLYFEADWCGPCQQMNPIVSRLKRQGYPVQTVDVDNERDLGQKFNVRSIPTFVLVVDRKERKRIYGVTSESQLRRMLAQIPANPPKAMPHETLPHKTLPYHGLGTNSEAGLTGQIVPNEKNFETNKIEPPTKEEVLKAVPESKLENVDPKSIKVKIEKVAEETGEPRFYPMVGPARLYKVRFKCTVTMDETIHSEWPVPFTHSDRRQEVVYIDHNHLIRTVGPTAADDKTSALEAGFWESLRTKHQFTDERQGWSITVADVRGKTLVKPTLQYTHPEKLAWHDYLWEENLVWKKLATKQAATGTVEFDLKNNQIVLHLTKGEVDLPGKRRAWFEKEDITLQLPEDAPAKAADARPIPPTPAILPAGHTMVYDLKDHPTPPAAKQKPNEKSAAEEERIAKALDKKITLKFDKTPLSEVARQIATHAGINLVIDSLGLSDEGVTPDEKITIDVKDVTLSSALQLILKPLRLAFLIQDEVLKITSETRVQGPLEVRTYAVADLVVPIPERRELRPAGEAGETQASQTRKPNTGQCRKGRGDGRGEPDGPHRDHVDPDSWAEKGGGGIIRFYETTLSLVIRQTPKVHEEIRDLLEQLRRLQDVQVCLEILHHRGGTTRRSRLDGKTRPGNRVVLVAPQSGGADSVG